MADKSKKKKQPTILIADDNKQTIELLKKFFSKANERKDINCAIIEAYNGDEAIQMLGVKNQIQVRDLAGLLYQSLEINKDMNKEMKSTAQPNETSGLNQEVIHG